MGTSALGADAVRSALSIGGALAGMELAYTSRIADGALTFDAVALAPDAPGWPSIAVGESHLLSDTFCGHMLGGAPRHTSAAATDGYAGVPLRETTGATSYLGVPLTDASGGVLGTLCALDRGSVPVGDRAQDAFALLAPTVAAAMFPAPAAAADVTVLRRPHGGWIVTGDPAGDEAADDLTSALVLADLISDDLAGPVGRPARADADADEVTRLRLSVAQLEHALSARVLVEQAIGVLVERRGVSPRSAFETLRSVARGSGRRVHDLAVDVVASATGPAPGLAQSLTRVTATPAGAPSPAAVANLVRARVPAP